MKTNYLFDDEDKKQRGIGVDRLGDKNDGLKLKWKSKLCQRLFTCICAKRNHRKKLYNRFE